jgi:uncharacterized membrane protein YccF (DUF307 family)
MESEVIAVPKGPGCLVQLLWFLLVGWWLAQIWVVTAWILCVSIIGLPFGVMMLNRVPQVLALRDPGEVRVRARRIGDNMWVYEQVEAPQFPLLIRALYFVLVGWWLSALWMILAYFICCTIIGLPLGVWMFDLVPFLVSLRR